MNQKEKKQYIHFLDTVDNNRIYIAEYNKRSELFRKVPEKLYKYRKFDKYSFEMIKNNYLYLSPVKGLDDPFDCIGDFDLTGIRNKKNGKLTSKEMERVIKSLGLDIKDPKVKTIKDVILKSFVDDKVDHDSLVNNLVKCGFDYFTAMELASMYDQFQSITDTYLDNKVFDSLGKLMLNPEDKLGVCSLSEIRDNKIMWSLYSKSYEGYCVEYYLPRKQELLRWLLPTLYSRKISNNFQRNMYNTTLANAKRQMSAHSPMFKDEIEEIGAIYYQFVVKDTDWAFQKEWRLIGNAEYHFTGYPIKALYLGFKVKKTNEVKMIRYAKKYKFDLYKMNPPSGKKTITYKLIYGFNNGKR